MQNPTQNSPRNHLSVQSSINGNLSPNISLSNHKSGPLLSQQRPNSAQLGAIPIPSFRPSTQQNHQVKMAPLNSSDPQRVTKSNNLVPPSPRSISMHQKPLAPYPSQLSSPKFLNPANTHANVASPSSSKLHQTINHLGLNGGAKALPTPNASSSKAEEKKVESGMKREREKDSEDEEEDEEDEEDDEEEEEEEDDDEEDDSIVVPDDEEIEVVEDAASVDDNEENLQTLAEALNQEAQKIIGDKPLEVKCKGGRALRANPKPNLDELKWKAMVVQAHEADSIKEMKREIAGWKKNALYAEKTNMFPDLTKRNMSFQEVKEKYNQLKKDLDIELSSSEDEEEDYEDEDDEDATEPEENEEMESEDSDEESLEEES